MPMPHSSQAEQAEFPIFENIPRTVSEAWLLQGPQERHLLPWQLSPGVAQRGTGSQFYQWSRIPQPWWVCRHLQPHRSHTPRPPEGTQTQQCWGGDRTAMPCCFRNAGSAKSQLGDQTGDRIKFTTHLHLSCHCTWGSPMADMIASL